MWAKSMLSHKLVGNSFFYNLPHKKCFFNSPVEIALRVQPFGVVPRHCCAIFCFISPVDVPLRSIITTHQLCEVLVSDHFIFQLWQAVYHSFDILFSFLKSNRSENKLFYFILHEKLVSLWIYRIKNIPY